jgi:hypothetical protein
VTGSCAGSVVVVVGYGFNRFNRSSLQITTCTHEEFSQEPILHTIASYIQCQRNENFQRNKLRTAFLEFKLSWPTYKCSSYFNAGVVVVNSKVVGSRSQSYGRELQQLHSRVALCVFSSPWKNYSCPLQRWRCSCKFRSRRAISASLELNDFSNRYNKVNQFLPKFCSITFQTHM